MGNVGGGNEMMHLPLAGLSKLGLSWQQSLDGATCRIDYSYGAPSKLSMQYEINTKKEEVGTHVLLSRNKLYFCMDSLDGAFRLSPPTDERHRNETA
jgi:hypothetical protein